MKYQKPWIAISTSLILLFVSIYVAGLEDKMISDKVRFSFEEEQKIWSKWFEENLDKIPIERLYLLGDEDYHREVEKELAEYYQDADFFLIHFERNIDNGVLSTSLFINNSNAWEQIEWTEDRSRKPPVVETKYKIADFNKELCQRAMNRYFYVEIDFYLFGGTSTYIYIFDKNKIGRFAFYGIHGPTPTHPAHKVVEQFLRGVDNIG